MILKVSYVEEKVDPVPGAWTRCMGTTSAIEHVSSRQDCFLTRTVGSLHRSLCEVLNTRSQPSDDTSTGADSTRDRNNRGHQIPANRSAMSSMQANKPGDSNQAQCTSSK